MKKMASVEIELDQRSEPFAIGRNGRFNIGKLIVWEGNTGRCFIDAVSLKTGNVLNAGISIDLSNMDYLAETWLKARGKYPKEK